MPATERKYALTQILAIVAVLIPLPVVLLWTALTKSHAPYHKNRSLKRILGDRAVQYHVSNLSVPQLQHLLGTTLDVYNTWTKQANLPVAVDELGDDARLLWIGPKRFDRVLFFCHGGGYLLPATDCSLSFWRYVQLELEKRKIEIGLAVLQYSLAPVATFPTPLNQARLALQFLFDAGVHPKNLQIAGNSAGGNLVLQLLSQMLHPRVDIPEISLPVPISGVCLISPWVSLAADSKSHTENDGIDILTKAVLADWGSQILAQFPTEDGASAFAQPAKAPEEWFKGAGGLVDRVLITAGEAECLRDDIIQFGEGFKKHHPGAELVIQEGGIHEDMFYDFSTNEKKLGSLTSGTIEWIATGFA